jgi:hypothetical protein
VEDVIRRGILVRDHGDARFVCAPFVTLPPPPIADPLFPDFPHRNRLFSSMILWRTLVLIITKHGDNNDLLRLPRGSPEDNRGYHLPG